MHMQNRKVPSQASSCSEPEYFWLTAEKFLIPAQGMTRKNFGSSVFLGKIGVAPACRSPSPPVGFTVILAGQKGLGMNTKIHPNCNLTATLQSGQAADART